MNKVRLDKVRFLVVSFVLVASQGLSAQKDTTFVAKGNPIVKYKYGTYIRPDTKSRVITKSNSNN